MEVKDIIMASMFAGGGSGGGGGLPAPTAADVGKTLVVKEFPVQGAVIVPEQTLNCVTPEGEEFAVAVVTDVDASLIASSDVVIFTFDDTVVETQIIGGDIGDFAEYGFAIQGAWDEEESKVVNFLYAAEAGEHTIKVIQKQARTCDTVIPEQEITVVDPDTPVSLTATEYPIAAGDTVLIEVIYELGTERYYDTLVDNGEYITTSDNLADSWAIGVLFYDNGTWTPAWKGLDGTYSVKISKVTYQSSYTYGFGIVGGGVFAVTPSGNLSGDRYPVFSEGTTLDKTWAEMKEAVDSGQIVAMSVDNTDWYGTCTLVLQFISSYDGAYFCMFTVIGSNMEVVENRFISTSAGGVMTYEP